MNVEQIRKRLHEEFTPFILRLSDGRQVSVPHPDYIAVGRHVVIVLDDEDFSVKIDPLHIVSLDDMRNKNGAR
jgi:hypothetical protein